MPEVLSSGNHEQIRRWRREQALRKTLRNRPDLLQTAELSAEERSFLRTLELPSKARKVKIPCKLSTSTSPRFHRDQESIMSIHPVMQRLADKLRRTDLPEFVPGDTVRVQVKIKEGDKERLQAFEGIVIALKNGAQGSFTVRKMSFGQGVERIFPFNSKVVDKVEKVRSARVRRSKLFYLRGLRGKAARLKEVERK